MSTRQKPEAYQTAKAVSETVRELNHATLNHEYSAPEISRIVGCLTEMSERLPQLLDQLCTQIAKRAREDQVRMEDGSDAAPHVAHVVAALGAARADVAGLTHTLSSARSYLFNMGAPWSDDEGDDDA